MNHLDFLLEGEAILVTDAFNRRYFSHVEHEEGVVIITRSKTVYFADLRSYDILEQKIKNSLVIPMVMKSFESIKEYLASKNARKLYIDYQSISVAEYKRYKKTGIKVVDGSKLIGKIRQVKSSLELENIKTACDIAQKAFYMTLPYIKAGVTETAVKNRLVNAMKKLGAEGESFSTIVAFGKNTAVPHHETGETKLKRNQPILIDWGCKVNGYCSDITRTFFYGKPNAEFENTFNLVAKANLVAQNKIKEGTSCKKADSYARNYFKSFGVDEYFTHSLGHGLGLEIHEKPFLSPKGKGSISKSVPFTIEPGLYYKDKFGIRIENTVVLTENGVISLTGDGRKLLII